MRPLSDRDRDRDCQVVDLFSDRAWADQWQAIVDRHQHPWLYDLRVKVAQWLRRLTALVQP